ncbi:ComEC/Rec2 family competence protein [Frigidibacter sp. MR17.14]|uniref:ComEC/Rec2 family competence protein n=1 Tax=Frigidibacter sp. MR17.14 TaxID=3126509 RepID=UPI0030129CDE
MQQGEPAGPGTTGRSGGRLLGRVRSVAGAVAAAAPARRLLWGDVCAWLARRAGPGPRQQLAEGLGRMLPLAPVCLGLGIMGWFGLPDDPGTLTAAAVGAAGAAALVLARGLPEDLRPLALAVALAAAGFLLAAARTEAVRAPVLGFRYYGPIEGRVVKIDRSWSDRLRVTLDRVRLNDLRPERTPAQVRLALHAEAEAFLPEPGMILRLTGHLSPPEGPVAPGAFDFRRLAWFDGLGALGYTRRPVELLGRDPGMGIAAHRARIALSRAMQARIEGQAGAFAAALMTGDRSGIDAATNDAMRGSNLSHMISISGLHMGMLAGFVFALVRGGLALVPPLALRLPAKKIAAGVALVATTFYLWLAGPEPATERSWIMAAVMLTAVLIDRRAVTLRTVAIAALILMVARPESLAEPGFQMSFAATVALILGWPLWARVQPFVPRLLRPAVALALSSLLAGGATAPIAAAHFNRIAEYGLLANMLTVPVMGAVVMPAGVIAAILGPVGLAGLPLWAMGWGCAWILFVADGVAGLQGAVSAVAAPPAAVLPLLAVGAAWALAARGALRAPGVAMLALAAALWAGAGRPALLVSPGGGLIGIMGPEGRAISKPKGEGFAADSWLEDDGDLADQATAAGRPRVSGPGVSGPAFTGPPGARRTELAGVPVTVLTGKAGLAALEASCAAGGLVVLADDRPEGWTPGPCDLWDARRLRWSGALAVSAGRGGLRIESVRDRTGWRAWTR